MNSTAQELVARARASIREIAPQRVASQSGELVVIDVREPAEFEDGHVEGAINIPRGVLEFQVESHPGLAAARDPALALREQSLVLYCRSGARSALAAASLQQMGFCKVESMAGGITAWAESGLPLSSR